MMRIIGILGGVAGGKSTVAEMFARLGAGILDADRVGHEVLRLPQVEEAARQRWGERIFGEDGHIDRCRLAQLVFAPGPLARQEREYLERLTHPEILNLLRREADEMAAAGVKVAVLDAPLLREAGWDELCEKMVFVDCPREERLRRALSRGWLEKDFSAREDAQDSLARKRASADVIIDNSGPIERTQAQVEQFWTALFR